MDLLTLASHGFGQHYFARLIYNHHRRKDASLAPWDDSEPSLLDTVVAILLASVVLYGAAQWGVSWTC